MSVASLTSAVVAGTGTYHEQALPVPSVVFPLIALGLFALLAIVAWSYRDVANRHAPGRSSGSQHH